MRRIILLCLLFFLASSGILQAQKEPVVSISLLGNDHIADVNVEQSKFIKSVEAIIALVKKEFGDVAAGQKIVLVMTFHKTGNPTADIFSKPSLPVSKEQSFLNALKTIKVENTKLVDFPVAISMNVKEGQLTDDFKEIVIPADKRRADYEKAPLTEKYELNKSWATSEVLPILSAYTSVVDEKFEGVKKMGQMLASTDFSKPQKITDLSDKNSNYWRAMLEMAPGNQVIPASKIFMLVSQGEFDYAKTLLDIVSFFSDPKTTTNEYLRELSWRLSLFNKDINAEVNAGISDHDKENYQLAIDRYKSLLAKYPYSAWAQYELYYSQKALDIQHKITTKEDASDWNIAKKLVYANNPLYLMDVHANNAKEGYLLFRRQGMNELFKVKDNRLSDVFKYADIALDLGVYDFAAQLFWFSFTYNKADEKSLFRFLYCLEKLGVTTIKSNFKGDFDKEFKKIDQEKEKEMKDSPIYKSFKS